MQRLGIVDVLLVEDNALDAEMIIRAIRKRGILNPLHVAEDGAEALDFIFSRGMYSDRDPSNLPKVILLDLKLPKVNGLEVLAAVKADERTRLIPVVIVTSSQEDPDVKRAYALGANSYVVKPVSSDTFIDTMSQLGMYWIMVNQEPR